MVVGTFRCFIERGRGWKGGGGVVVEFLIVEGEFKNAHEFINIKLKLISEKLGKNFLPN